MHVVLAGSGTMKVDDERVPVAEMDVIRIPPGVTRAFEACPDGLDYLVYGHALGILQNNRIVEFLVGLARCHCAICCCS